MVGGGVGIGSCEIIPNLFSFPADLATAAKNLANKEEVDSRSVFVGNVRFLSMLTLCLPSYSGFIMWYIVYSFYCVVYLVKFLRDN